MYLPLNRVKHTLICIAAVVGYFIVPIIIILLLGTTSAILTSSYSTFLISLLIILPYCFLAWFYYQKKFQLMPLGNIDWNILFFTSFAFIALTFINGFLGVDEHWEDSLETMSASSTFFYYIMLMTLAPITEEIIFRGFLLNAGMWYGAIGKWAAIFGSSFLFSIGHIQYSSATTFIVLFISGIMLCLARIYSRSLITPILLHVFNNTFAVLWLLI